jgi:2-polyprenyl-3-methyl-5-hydroxy-6-metoxy-1,4-benzoquinol methylase
MSTPPRIGIIVVAYNAATTLAKVLDRIPRSFVPQIADVLVCDDASQDSTFLVGLGYQQVSNDLPLTVLRRDENLGYGGNQKAAYRWSIEHELDIVVLLHGDGQYAPEHLPNMVAPLVDDECDVVLGSRMMEKGAARKGGMPLYKFVGNRILSTAQNRLAGASLTEWHSGYRAYRVNALADVPFEQNHDGFDFDTQIILQMLESGKRIKEIPIPTYYGDEICYVDGIGYARDVMRDTIRYRANKIGFGGGTAAFASTDYDVKEGALSSHGKIVEWMADRRPARILDLGCSGGQLAAALRKHGHHVTGVDVVEIEGVRDHVDEFMLIDLERGIGEVNAAPFDVVLAADVLEHVKEPEQLLEEARGVLAPDGVVLACVPNFGHWYARARVASGTFAYERRGILDAGHVRFFTRRSFRKLVGRAGYSETREATIGLPFEVFARGSTGKANTAGRVLSAFDRVAVAVWPTMFAYQFLAELRPAR